MQNIPGITDLKLFRVVGQPNLNFTVDRQQAARFGLNVADVQDAVETAVGGKAVSTVLQGEERYDVVVRYQEPYRRTRARRSRTSACCRRPASACRWRSSRRWRSRTARTTSTAKATQRYVAITFNVRGRDLNTTVEDAMRADQAEGQAAARLSHRTGRASTRAKQRVGAAR